MLSVNAWTWLSGMLAADPTEVVLIVQHNGDGTSTVEYPGSGGQQARKIGQSVAIGKYAYVDGAGRIVGEAPSLPYGEDLV
jgi:hypothetical protein